MGERQLVYMLKVATSANTAAADLVRDRSDTCALLPAPPITYLGQ
jgi:hypothetical protein